MSHEEKDKEEREGGYHPLVDWILNNKGKKEEKVEEGEERWVD